MFAARGSEKGKEGSAPETLHGWRERLEQLEREGVRHRNDAGREIRRVSRSRTRACGPPSERGGRRGLTVREVRVRVTVGARRARDLLRVLLDRFELARRALHAVRRQTMPVHMCAARRRARRHALRRRVHEKSEREQRPDAEESAHERGEDVRGVRVRGALCKSVRW
jgi:hypothetical protein